MSLFAFFKASSFFSASRSILSWRKSFSSVIDMLSTSPAPPSFGCDVLVNCILGGSRPGGSWYSHLRP
eukprot:581443-Pyramimonas_sp.AAC.1